MAKKWKSVPQVSAATDYLTNWINKAEQRAPSITRVTVQSWPGVGPPPNFKPGIASYGWGINGTIIRDGNGNPIGLRFGTINVWFSDRGLDLFNPPPNSGQQFISNQSDVERMSFTVEGDEVQLEVVLATWNSQYVVTTSTCDQPSQQLIFSVPGAGPNAPQALLIVSFADTGEFGWI
jgi:hypothetical protein